MRYAIFSDIHANLEALEAVLAKIDEISQKEPIDQIWFLGDLVGYGPNPNECIIKLRERTDVIIAGNHDWAAVGKIDLEDFSAAARISAEWTTEQLTEEHHNFLANLPEHLEIDDCTLVHGSPYGPLWEYLTSRVLAERSFQCFGTCYCFVGHTHVPVIFQQPDPTLEAIINAPTLPLSAMEASNAVLQAANQTGESAGAASENHTQEEEEEEEETAELVVIHPTTLRTNVAAQAESAYANPETGQPVTEAQANVMIEAKTGPLEQSNEVEDTTNGEGETGITEETTTDETTTEGAAETAEAVEVEEEDDIVEMDTVPLENDVPYEEDTVQEDKSTSDDHDIPDDTEPEPEDQDSFTEEGSSESTEEEIDELTPEILLSTEGDLNNEEVLQLLLGLSESMVQVTNEMLTPPEGHWELRYGYRAIINPGSVGQPRDGDPRAAFMIYDSERGFEFYRIPYAMEKTQEKIIKAGLPQYLAIRLAYGR